MVNITDLGLLATNWQQGVGNPLGPESFEAAVTSVGLPQGSVPEPATLGALGALIIVSAQTRLSASKRRKRATVNRARRGGAR
jgi:hypothetical protein